MADVRRQMAEVVCATDGCDNEAPSRTHCSTCRVRQYRHDKPFRYQYQMLKDNAKRRGKVFDLSFEEFKALWKEHPEKWTEKMKPGQCKWQVDRIDPTKGYAAGNVQILEKSLNVIKYQKHGRHRVEFYFREKNGQADLAETAPF